MEDFTFKDLENAISNMTDEQKEQPVRVSIEDEMTFRRMDSLQFVDEDIYYNTSDAEDCGTLEELKDAHGEDFEIGNYKLITAKGTPFIYDGDQ